jgi:5'-3' exoribonuclease 2
VTDAAVNGAAANGADALTLPHPTTRVVLSDATEPGEGEHKIMDHLRAHPPAPDASVVIYGQDADLLMLAFAYRSTHAVPVYILREKDVMPTRKPVRKGAARAEEVRTRVQKVRQETEKRDDEAGDKVGEEEGGEVATPEVATTEPAPSPAPAPAADVVTTNDALQFVNIAELETHILQHMEAYGDVYAPEDRPSVMRDYVALCFLLGNDFLPHGPSLAIPADGLDVLFVVCVNR